MSTTVTYKGSTLTTVENATKKLTTEGTWLEADVIITDVTSGGANLQSKSVSYTPTTSAQSQTVTADSGYDGLSSVAVSVAAMPSGTAGTPTATKGTVSNHSVSVTPSVTNTTGYITGGTKTGTAVSVSASELVSGNLSITQNGTGINVTNYATVDVSVSGGGTTVDCPVFTLEYDADITDVQYISCNMYYQEIYDYVTGSGQYNNAYAAIVKGEDYDSATTFTYGCYYHGRPASGLVFVVMDEDTPIADITVYQDETITVTAPSIAIGTEGTPTATKGTVSNHSVSVTPSVTNSAGYISGGTKTGTAVTVSASELDSGTKSISANGTGIDVVGYASVDVEVPSPLIVTLSKDSNDEWYPNKTFAELSAAREAQIPVVVNTNANPDGVSADGQWMGVSYYNYWVREYVGSPLPEKIIEQSYTMGSQSTGLDEEYEYINPSGTLSITSNGTVNVRNYASVNVNVASGGYTLEQVNAVGFPGMTETNVVMGSATTLRPFMFRGNTSITSFSGANITDTKGDGYGSGAESHTFQNCTNLVSASLPKVKDLYHTDYIFSGCTKLQTCEMDWMNMTRLGTGVFQGCSALQKTSFVLPKLASNVYGYFISANPNLTAFDMGSASINMGNYNVAANAFNGDSNLSVFVIRCTNRVYSLANVSAFTNTPFANGKAGGTLYVPNSLIASYQSATNWVTILGYANNQIKSIESTATDPDAPIDLTTHYIDGTLI